jgi:hypothetical protein
VDAQEIVGTVWFSEALLAIYMQVKELSTIQVKAISNNTFLIKCCVKDKLTNQCSW